MMLTQLPRRLLSMILAAALFLSLTRPALAEEHALEPFSTWETTAASENTAPATEPVETRSPEDPVQETASPETIPPETLPVETAPEAETLPLETEPPETEPAPAPILTIAQVLALPAGTENIQVQGTVVFAQGNQAILQDQTGGIRLSLPPDTATVPGEILLVTGSRSTGLTVWDFESLGSGELPATETTLIDAPDCLRVLVRGVTLEERNLTHRGFSLELVSDSSLAVGTLVDAWGVILDGIFYGDTLLPSQAVPQDNAPEAPGASTHYNHYFGQLHAHSDDQTPGGSIPEIFSNAARQENLDFFAITDHSDALDNPAFCTIQEDGTLVSTQWKEGKEAAEAITTGSFLGIYAYEISWPEDLFLGHMNTFGTPGWQIYQDQTLESYFSALETVPNSVSQFNHPCNDLGNFNLFEFFSPKRDQSVHLMEVGYPNKDTLFIDYYSTALDLGWHLAPSCNPGKADGIQACLNPARTVVLAEELTEQSLYEAIRAYRVYATADSDLVIDYYMNGAILGSILGPCETLSASISLSDPTDEGSCQLEVIAEGGKAILTQTIDRSSATLELPIPTGYSYYYLKITQNDQLVAMTAPIWVDHYEDMGIQSFTSDFENPMEDQTVSLTLELFNHESVDFKVAAIDFFLKDTLIHSVQNPGTVQPMKTQAHSFSFTQPDPGIITITASVTGTANGYPQSFTQTLDLAVQAKQVEKSTIGNVRRGSPGMVYRVSGRLTSGTSNRYNTFPGMVYLQDETGGIAVSGSFPYGMAAGTPMEVTGILRQHDHILELEMIRFDLPGGRISEYPPLSLACETAMDYEAHGGKLLQTEGTVVSLTKTADTKGISRLTLKDLRGGLATVVIEDDIRSGAYGSNTLASQIRKGRTVRVIGLLHRDEFGNSVLRVRNCEEVEYVPAKADPSNPRTGDWWMLLKQLWKKSV